jgi:hypothetical protein
MTEAEPAPEMLHFFKIANKGKCPRICISLMTHLHQKPLD